MSQFGALLSKEVRFWLQRPGVHLFALMFGSLGVMTMLALAGQIEFIQIGGMGGLKKADSVNQLTELTLVWSLFATMNLAAAAGGAATRDVTEGSHPLVFSAPVPKLTLLASRYLGAVGVSAYLLAAIPVGLFVGRFVPGLEAERIGAFDPLPTLASIVVWVGPNLLFVTALFFGIGALTRRMFPIYLGGVLLFVGYLGSSAFTADLDDHTVAVLMDPFGTRALEDVSRYWSAEQTNTLVPWPSGRSLANRLLWIAVGIGGFALAVRLTRLDQHGWQPLARLQRAPAAEGQRFDEALAVPAVSRSFTPAARIAQLIRLARRSVLDVVGHRYFWGFVGASVLFQLLNTQAIGTLYGTDTLPVTYAVLEVLLGTLQLFVVLVVTFYAGDLVWAERDNGQAQLLDSAPVPDWAPMLAKLLALTVLVVALHLVPMILGPVVQLAMGYTHLEPGQYLQTVGLALLDWVPLIALSLCVHVVVNHKMVGHVILIGFWISQLFRLGLGFENNLFWIGSDPGRMYSDMNAWGHSLGGVLLYKAYWSAFAVVLAAVTRLAWVRGNLTLAGRWREARRRLDPVTVGALVVPGTVTAALAGTIAYQTHVVGDYQTDVGRNRRLASLERTYQSEWLDAPHPEVVVIDAEVDLYPDEGRAETRATFELVNPHDVAIERMMVSFGDKAQLRSMTLSIPYTEVDDDEHEVSIWTLAEPMAPGQTATMSFHTTYLQQGLPNSGFEDRVVPNGTMLHHPSVFPNLGYERSWELSDPADRRKYDLPERRRMRDLDDPKARLHNYVNDDAQRVTMTAKVSHRRGPDPDGAGGSDRPGRRRRPGVADLPARRSGLVPVRLPVGRLGGDPIGRWPGPGRGLRLPRPPVQHRSDDRGDERIHRDVRAGLRAVPARDPADHRVPPLPDLRPVPAGDGAVLRGHRLHRRCRRSRRGRRLRLLRDRPRGGPPVVGPPGLRRGRPGGDGADREPVPVQLPEGDGGRVRRRSDSSASSSTRKTDTSGADPTSGTRSYR